MTTLPDGESMGSQTPQSGTARAAKALPVLWNGQAFTLIKRIMRVYPAKCSCITGLRLKAMLYVFSGCRQFIRTVPSLVYSTADVEDVDTSAEDHIYDETRYVAMERKILPRAPHQPGKQVFDPLRE